MLVHTNQRTLTDLGQLLQEVIISSNTSEHRVRWEQPTLSNYGTIGGNAFAVAVDGAYSSYYGWKAFDGQTSTMFEFTTAQQTHYILMYNPYPLYVTDIAITNRNGGSNPPKSTVLKAANDLNTWTVLTTVTSPYTTATGQTWTITVPYNKRSYYTYYKLDEWTGVNYHYPDIAEINLVAYYNDTAFDVNNVWVAHKPSSYYIKY